MPNLAFHIETLDLVTKQLQAGGDPKGTLLANPSNQPFAALGALGPDLLRYAPPSKQLLAALDNLVKTGQPLTTLQIPDLIELFFNPLGSIYALVFRDLVIPLWPVLDKIKAFLDKADAVAQAEDKIAAVELALEVPGIINQANGLKNTLPQAVTNLVPVIGQIIALPPWMQQSSSVPLAPSDPKANRLSEFLRWHKSGAFAAALVKLASTPAQQAFALGWLVHHAASTTGEPFVNNIAGGPYRTHWWRNRLIGNFVDSWTFGFVQSGAHMMGDNPTPPYASWTPLCTANLQHRFNVTGIADSPPLDIPDFVKAAASGDLGALPGSVPQDLADLFMKAIAATYPAATQPTAGFSADQFKASVLGALAVYWFMTSGRGPLGVNAIGAAPTNCLSAPTWISSGSAPSPQQAGLNTGGAVCAAILAILALLAFALGDIPAGLGALAAAFNAPIIDWGTVRCNLFWIRKMLIDAENGLRDLIVTSGLAYPPPSKLGTVDPNGNTIPAVDKTAPNGIPLCKTNSLSAARFAPATYPHLMDTSNPQAPPDTNFGAFPMVGAEAPTTAEQIPADKYPDFVLNGAGLPNGGLMTDGVFPSRNAFFGDAVSNALDVLSKVSGSGGKLPDYNLDGDRGYGWKGWHPASGSQPSAPPVQAQQD